MHRSVGRLTAGLAVIAMSLAACGSGSTGSTAGDPLRVVAAENFYGDLARQIGGRHVTVTSILSSAEADPHLFEPGSRNGLAVANARVVIRNGAGYDGWMSKLLAASPSSHRTVVTVAEVLHVTGPDPNPHLWYDTPALPMVVAAIEQALVKADPTHAADYAAGERAALAELAPLNAAVENIKARYAGSPVAYTERVAGLLLAAAGLTVLTPPAFARAVEDGIDPSPASIEAMLRLLSEHRVKVLIYNEQAASPVTARLQAAARAANIPVVPVTETEPPGQTFVSWQLGQVQALAKALQG